MIPSLEAYQLIAEDNLWISILPEITIAVLALAILVLDLTLPPHRRKWLGPLAAAGIVTVSAGIVHALVQAPDPFGTWTTFNGMVRFSAMGEAMRLFFLAAGLVTCLLGSGFMTQRRQPQTEFIHTTLVLTAAFMLLSLSNHFVLLYICLETVTVGFYILVSYLRSQSRSLEGGLKYLILGALSSAIMLFGIVLLYGVGSDPSLVGSSGDPLLFDNLSHFLALNADHPLALTGIVLVLAGVAFKIGSVPFQIWIPDVYQGAPTPVTAFLAVASKAAGVFVLLNLLAGPFAAVHDILLPLLAAMAAVSMLYGNFAALGQRHIKRLLGLSGISHAGFLLMGLAASLTVPWAAYAVVFYLVTYLLASFGVFAVVQQVSGTADDRHGFQDYTGLMRKQPLLASALVVGLGSLAGIPPMGGFIAKLLLLIAAVQAGLLLLVGCAVLGVVLSIYYYFGWMRAAVFPPPASADPGTGEVSWIPPSLIQRIVLCVLTVLSVLIGLYQGELGSLLSN